MPGPHWFVAFALLAGGDAPATMIKPATPPAPGMRHYVVQVRILEIDDQGRATIVATPTVQTTGAAAGVTIDAERGRRFEFHFSATEPGAPSPLPVLLVDDPVMPKPIATTSSVVTAERTVEHRVTLKAQQQPRRDLLKEIARQTGLKFVIEPDAITAAAGPLTAPVTCHLENVPLEHALQQLVQPTGLGYRVAAGYLLVEGEVTPENRPAPLSDPEEWLVKVYDVSDLVRPSDGDRPDFRPLLSELRQQVLPKSWDSNGGEASARGFDSTVSLVIRQTTTGHEAIAAYLAQRRMKK